MCIRGLETFPVGGRKAMRKRNRCGAVGNKESLTEG